MIFNDITARDIQRREMRSGVFSFCKAIDTFCPLGPWIVTPDEIPDPHDLAMELRVNGEPRQESHSSRMSVTIPEILAHYSALGYSAGDVVSTGTVAGRRRLQRGRRLALPAPGRRDRGRDRADRRAAQPGHLLAGGPRRAGAAAGWCAGELAARRGQARARPRADGRARSSTRSSCARPTTSSTSTDFWRMKGYDACVFPREGEPVLIVPRGLSSTTRRAHRPGRRTCAPFAATTSATRGPPARAHARARAGRAARARPDRARRARALAGHAGRRPHGRRADDLPALVRRLRRRLAARRSTRSALLARARAIKTAQEIERMRLANEICARRRWSTCATSIRPGMRESEAAAICAGLRPRRGHRLARARSSSRWASRSSGRDRASDVHRDRRPRRRRATSRRCSRSGSAPTATGATTPRSLCPGELTRRLRELERRPCSRSTARAIDHCRPAPASPSSTGWSAPGSPRSATPASPRTRSATASARAPTSRPTPTRPAAARSRRAWCSRSSPAATGRAAAGCGSRTTS